MKMADFKALSLEERLTKLNNHLLSLKQLEGRLEDNFKTGAFRIIRSAREIWLTIFYSIYRLIVAGVERTGAWDLIPTTKLFALYLLTHD